MSQFSDDVRLLADSAKDDDGPYGEAARRILTDLDERAALAGMTPDEHLDWQRSPKHPSTPAGDQSFADAHVKD